MAKIKVNIGTVEAPIWLEMDAKNADTLNGVSMTQIQQKIDEAVQKANEAFTSASNGKILIRDTILAKEGHLVDADGDGIYTFQELADGINTLQGEDISEGLNAVAGDILASKTAAVNGSVLTGTIATQNTSSITSNGSYPAGYYPGAISVAVPDASQGLSAVAGNILSGKTALVNGSVITGTIPTRIVTGSIVTNGSLAAGYYSSSVTIAVPAYTAKSTPTSSTYTGTVAANSNKDITVVLPAGKVPTFIIARFYTGSSTIYQAISFAIGVNQWGSYSAYISSSQIYIVNTSFNPATNTLTFRMMNDAAVSITLDTLNVHCGL